MKTFTMLAASLFIILSFFTGCNTAEDVFNVSVEEGHQYKGFLFKLKEETDLSKMPEYIEEGVFKETFPEIRLYFSETVEAVKARFSSADIEYIEPNYAMQLMD